MFGAGIDAQVTHLLAPQRPARDHALDRLFEHALGEAAFEHLAGGDALDAARIAGVPVIDLARQLVAGEAHLVRVDDDDVVTAIDVRGEARLVLAAQDIGDDRRRATDHQAIGIDDMPFLLHLVRLDRLGGLHQRLHGAWTSCLKRRAPPSRDGANGWANTECVPEVKRLRGLASGYYDTGAVESGVRGVVDPLRDRRIDRKSTRLTSSH